MFYHFLFAVSFGNWAPKMSEKFWLDRKIGFQNTFYTKCIDVIIESIGPSIILRSIYQNKYTYRTEINRNFGEPRREITCFTVNSEIFARVLFSRNFAKINPLEMV